MSAPAVTSPIGLAHLRLWLLDQWRSGRPYAEAAARHHTAMARQRTPGAAHMVVRDYSAWERRSLSTATLWWVSAEMVDVLVAATPSMPDDVKQADLPRPSPSGLVVLEKPWWGTDANRPDEKVRVDAFVWGLARLPAVRLDQPPDGVLALGVSHYRRIDFGAGLNAHEMQMGTALGFLAHAIQRPIGRLTEDNPGGQSVVTLDRPRRKSEAEGLSDRMTLDATTGRAYELVGTSWAPLGRSDWPESDELGRTPWPMDEPARTSFLEDRRMIASLWTLLAQRLTSTSMAPADRALRRRSERSGVPAPLADVRIVRLRRAERTREPAAPTPGRHVGVRFVVSAHFCWQPYGPGRSLRKLIVRGPYVKGPPDAPLHAPKVVRAWTR